MNVLELASQLIMHQSDSQLSNFSVADFLQSHLARFGFDVEWLEYADGNGVPKACLVAKAGTGSGGLGFFSHSDTVPGMPGGWNPYQPVVEGGRLVGRGSCDMKGPLAAALAAAARVPVADLSSPLYFVITSDEEMHYAGAYHVVASSDILRNSWPVAGIVTEPTALQPVHSHKGGIRIRVTAQGVAAHTSTDRGVSANFIIAPFLAEMAQLAELFRTDERFMNGAFDPPTNGFNMVLTDGDCAPNVTAAETVCTLSIRPMPGDHSEETVQMITGAAERYGLEVSTSQFPYVFTDPDSDVARAAMQAVNASSCSTVPYGTEAAIYKEYTDLVILGPGSIDQAHTVGEWIDIDEMTESVDVYERLLRHFCL